MSSEVQQAREALGVRLREIRKAANLTGRALASLAGWHPAKITKIEYGRQYPSEDDLRAWCRWCGAEDQLPDLIATVRDIDSAYVEWRRKLRTGHRRTHEASFSLYEQARLFRIYHPSLVPGLFQTAEYATAIMRRTSAFLEVPDDVDEAVAVRLERQRVLYAGDRRFLAVLEEQALRTPVGDVDTMTGQLDRLMAVMSLQRLSLGVIPSRGPRQVWPAEGFFIFDDATVRVETVSAHLTVTQPREIALYTKTFRDLQRSAAYGQAARALVASALADLSRD